MKIPHLSWIFVALCLCVRAEGDIDFVDTETEEDAEAALKCDACKIVASKFAEAFADIQGSLKPTISPKDEEIIEAAEGTCDEAWEGYGVVLVEGVERLAGPGSDVKSTKVMLEDGIWSRRLQDMCDELLGEAPDEKTLYHTWASGGLLEEYLCRGEGTFGACSAGNWGPWPGDEYDDYDDSAEFEDIHDEF
ncbi:marginal zone B- and B1-cell-specific protein-like [Panulirus ornatus]|uniref:marginal zone B- and B1-cell-specific protein-like n=1 Tax=Panulirus ornatus TaxID=150431 RepID=UPI003A84D2D8